MKTLNVVHLSDLHLCEDGKLLDGCIDSWARARSAFKSAAFFAPDAVVVTGDVADRGASIYSRAARFFASAENELNCPVITVPGNHDPSGAINERFNTWRIASGPHAANTVHQIHGLRIIGLDSGGFQQPQGLLDLPQLQWLGQVLTEPAPRGTLVLIHHPPVDSFSPELADRGLVNPEELALVVSGSDVRGILSGHYHQPATGSLKGTLVSMAPAVSYNTNPYASEDLNTGFDSSSFSLVRLNAQGISFTTVPVRSLPRRQTLSTAKLHLKVST